MFNDIIYFNIFMNKKEDYKNKYIYLCVSNNRHFLYKQQS
jgi:hypothetical protein